MHFFYCIQDLTFIFLFQRIAMPVLVGPLHEDTGADLITGVFQKRIGEYQADEFINFRIAVCYFVDFFGFLAV
jgi:hypothetical protein